MPVLPLQESVALERGARLVLPVRPQDQLMRGG